MGDFERGLVERYDSARRRLKGGNGHAPIRDPQKVVVPIRPHLLELSPLSTGITIDDITITYPSLTLIIGIVSKKYDVEIIELKGQMRTMRVMVPRQIFCWLSTKLTLRSLPEIGKFLGGRDHSTIIHSRNKIERLSRNNVAMFDELKLLRAEIAERHANG